MQYQSDTIYIRFLQETDAEAMLSLHLRNKDFFEQYSPTRSEAFFTLDCQLSKIQKGVWLRENDHDYVFGIFLKSTDQLIGTVSLTQILRGPLQSCIIGYSLDKAHNGKGYMTEAVRLAVGFGFEELKLHRIEAGVMPHNIASIRVLEKAGFHKEGIARKNVKINDKWEDHQMLAIISDND